MSVRQCDRYGATECAAGVCYLCGSADDEYLCPDDVTLVASPLGMTRKDDRSAWVPTTLHLLAFKNCPSCSAVMYRVGWDWECACGETWTPRPPPAPPHDVLIPTQERAS